MLKHLAPYRIEIFLLLLALLPAFYIALGNPNTILDWYSSDDGFLYFQVAKNLASGHGFTFDSINPTNGFHPLWLLLITPIFALAQIDLHLPLRVLIVFSALLSAGAAILLFRILRRFTGEWIAVFVGLLWIALPRIHDLTLHAGVEAGINVFFVLLFWHSLSATTIKGATPRQLIGISLLGILAILARLDNIFLIGLGGIWLLLLLWRPLAKLKQNPWLWRLQNALAFYVPIGIILLIYIAWNYLAFGTFTPISGEVKLWWGTLKNTVYGFPVNSAADFLGQLVTDDPELGPWSLLTSPLYAAAEWLLAAAGFAVTVASRRLALLLISALGLALLGIVTLLQRDFLNKSTRALGLLPFFLGCLAQITYYKVAGSVAQQPWYWITEMVLLHLMLGLFLQAIVQILQQLASNVPASLRQVAGLAVLGVIALSYLGFIQTAIRAPGDGSNHFYIHRARWLETNTELGARVAITGAGNLAYFIVGRTIINMDGLMNTHEYLLALQSGKGADYLASLGVDYIFGNEYILTETNPYAPMLAGNLEPYAVYTFADRELPLWRFIP